MCIDFLKQVVYLIATIQIYLNNINCGILLCVLEKKLKINEIVNCAKKIFKIFIAKSR